jgi:hypothetical protein
MNEMAATPKALDRKTFEGAPISDMVALLLGGNGHVYVPLPVSTVADVGHPAFRFII